MDKPQEVEKKIAQYQNRAIRTGDYSATSFLGAFSASSAAPGRRERAIKNCGRCRLSER